MRRTAGFFGDYGCSGKILGGWFLLSHRDNMPVGWPTRLLRPSLWVASVYDIPLHWLKDRSIRAVVTDLDNTLVPYRDYHVATNLAGWFDSLHREGFRTVILSNCIPSRQVEDMARLLGTHMIAGARKPAARAFRRAMEFTGTKPAETCVVGDQIFTDVLGGNMVGCWTILVDRIGDREFFTTRVLRLLERRVMGYLARTGLVERQEAGGKDERGAGPHRFGDEGLR